ncbi:Methyltransferase [Coniochaeta hoffmannii]|uniref:Methyltransferase n=1 Tax=Coniochaeta hoffmannii TaxID=91930 RepID=A0AA38RID5_9PEZI|nr:Methyltransferase [Coniochaeta hoffmannii]
MSHQAGYTQGYSASTVSNHAIRTVDTDAAFVLPHIKPSDKILDIGCGPGSITAGFTRYATEGSVIGVDLSDEVLDMARASVAGGGGDSGSQSSRGGAISFVKADVLAGLPFPDDEFDIVFASQLFPHLPGDTSLRAMQEMRRVLKPGGILATRDAAEVHWYPARLGLDRTMTQRILRGVGSQNFPGGGLPALARKAGFDVDADGTGPEVAGRKMKIGLGTTVNFGKEARARFANGFLGRLDEGDQYRKSWLEAGITESEIEESRAALTEWKATEDAWYLGVHSEILAWK